MLLDNEDVVECGSPAAPGLNRLIFLCCESGFREVLCVCSVHVYEASEGVPVCTPYVCMHKHKEVCVYEDLT